MVAAFELPIYFSGQETNTVSGELRKPVEVNFSYHSALKQPGKAKASDNLSNIWILGNTSIY